MASLNSPAGIYGQTGPDLLLRRLKQQEEEAKRRAAMLATAAQPVSTMAPAQVASPTQPVNPYREWMATRGEYGVDPTQYNREQYGDAVGPVAPPVLPPRGAGDLYGTPTSRGQGYQSGFAQSQYPEALAAAIALNPANIPGGDRMAAMGYTPQANGPALYVGGTPVQQVGPETQRAQAEAERARIASILRQAPTLGTMSASPSDSIAYADSSATPWEDFKTQQKMSLESARAGQPTGTFAWAGPAPRITAPSGEKVTTGGTRVTQGDEHLRTAKQAERRENIATRKENVATQAAMRGQRKGHATPTPAEQTIMSKVATGKPLNPAEEYRYYGREAAEFLAKDRAMEGEREARKTEAEAKKEANAIARDTLEATKEAELRNAENAELEAVKGDPLLAGPTQRRIQADRAARAAKQGQQQAASPAQPQGEAPAPAPKSPAQANDPANAVMDRIALSGEPQAADDIARLRAAGRDDMQTKAEIARKYGIPLDDMDAYFYTKPLPRISLPVSPLSIKQEYGAGIPGIF